MSRPVRASSVLFALSIVLSLAAGPVDATGLLVVNQPWVRPARAGQDTEAFMDLTSTAGAMLTAVESPVAAGAVLRGPKGTRARSAASVDQIVLPAGRLVPLAPGAYRVALRAVLRALKPGDRVPMTLTILYDDGSRGSIPVDAEVRLRSPIEDERRAHSHAHH